MQIVTVVIYASCSSLLYSLCRDLPTDDPTTPASQFIFSARGFDNVKVFLALSMFTVGLIEIMSYVTSTLKTRIYAEKLKL